MANNLVKYQVLSKIDGSPATKLLYGYLLDLEQGAIIMSQRKIAAHLGVSRSTVQRNMKRLKQNGRINSDSRFSEDGGRLANKYRIN